MWGCAHRTLKIDDEDVMFFSVFLTYRSNERVIFLQQKVKKHIEK